MHWFDDFSKGIAGGRPNRSAVLGTLARFAAGAVVAPLAVSVSPARAAVPGPSQSPPSGRRVVPSIRPRPIHVTPPVVHRGACTFVNGSAMDVSVTSSSLTAKIHLDLSPRLAPQRKPAASSAQRKPAASAASFVLDITDRGAPVMRAEANVRPSATHAVPDGTLAIHYGSQVHGASRVALTAKAGRITGTIDGRAIESLAAGGSKPATTRLATGHELAVTAEPAIHAALPGLNEALKRALATCEVPVPPQPHATHGSIRGTSPQRILTREERRPSTIADATTGYDDGSGGGQNWAAGGIFSGSAFNTPHCYAAIVDLGLTLDGCLVGALVGAFFCPPCSFNAVLACYSAAAGAELNSYRPGGACNEVSCGGFAPGPKSCDYGTFCCGEFSCCPTGDGCATAGFCCTPDHPITCGSSVDSGFCCPTNTICGTDNQCLTCGPGLIAHNGSCCNFLCGDDCCTGQAAYCDHATNKCANYSFGTPAPKRTSNAHCPAPYVPCAALNPDNSYTEICCPAGGTCCNGTCCAPGLYCGGPVGYMGCGNWIK